MDAELRTRIAGAVAVSGPRGERAHAAADLIREATAARWVGIYTVNDTTVSNDAWSGPGPPAFPSFPVTSGLTAHALRTGAAYAQGPSRSATVWRATLAICQIKTIQDPNSLFPCCTRDG